jgi:hypothetical protein
MGDDVVWECEGAGGRGLSDLSGDWGEWAYIEACGGGGVDVVDGENV